MLNKELSSSAEVSVGEMVVPRAEDEQGFSCTYTSEWRPKVEVSTWDWRTNRDCFLVSSVNVRERQRYVTGVVIRPGLTAASWSSSLVWNIDSTRKRYKSVCFLKPSHHVVKHFESIYAWPRSEESFEEILASKGLECLRAELIVELSSLSGDEPAVDSCSSSESDEPSGCVAEGDIVPSPGVSPGQGGEVKADAELHLGVIVMDGSKDRS